MKHDSYGEFEAVTLFCPRCQKPVEVRKKLLLILPESDKYEYTCPVCGESLGSKLDKSAGFGRLSL